MEFIRTKSERPHIEIAPLVDIIFLLLIFFMLSSNFMNPVISTELPDAVSGNTNYRNDIIIVLDENRNLYVNSSKIEIDYFEKLLKREMDEKGIYDVVFRGDKSVSYEVFVEILDRSKLAGAKSFSVEHNKQRQL